MSSPGRRGGRLPVHQQAPRRWGAGLARAACAGVLAVASAVAAPAAQVPLPGDATTLPPDTTTTAPPAPPPTSAPVGEPPATTPGPPDTTPPPVAESPPAAGPAPAPPAEAPGPAPALPAEAPDAPGAAVSAGDDPPTPAAGEVPEAARRAMASVRRSPSNSTKRLLAALAPLQDLGFSEQEAVAAGFGRFPVGGYATFSHDWLFPRFTPSFHMHQGTDIFAVTGTPVRSPADGTLKLAQGGAGGLAAYVYQADGTYFYMAHLSAFVEGQRPGQTVQVGDVVGFVGDSGNARGGSPHVHFEIHPAPTRNVVSGKGKGRTVTQVVRPVAVGSVLPAMDPKATLDKWLADALAAVPQLVAAAESRPRAAAAATTRQTGGGRRATFRAPVVPPRSQLLWASSVSPSGGAVRLAEAAALLAASEFDWSVAARRHQELLAEHAAARARTAALLGPLTPPTLRPPTSGDA